MGSCFFSSDMQGYPSLYTYQIFDFEYLDLDKL